MAMHVKTLRWIRLPDRCHCYSVLRPAGVRQTSAETVDLSQPRERGVAHCALPGAPAKIAADAFSDPSACFFARTTTFAPGVSFV
jgi:hypothetical protein